MAKNNDEVLDKKVRARLREDILSEINTSVKDDLVETVANDMSEEEDEEAFNDFCAEVGVTVTVEIKGGNA